MSWVRIPSPALDPVAYAAGSFDCAERPRAEWHPTHADSARVMTANPASVPVPRDACNVHRDYSGKRCKRSGPPRRVQRSSGLLRQALRVLGSSAMSVDPSLHRGKSDEDTRSPAWRTGAGAAPRVPAGPPDRARRVGNGGAPHPPFGARHLPFGARHPPLKKGRRPLTPPPSLSRLRVCPGTRPQPPLRRNAAPGGSRWEHSIAAQPAVR